MSKAHMYSWDTEAGQACAVIAAGREPLRLILKTKDEEELLERWLRHHLGILPAHAKIIILDNMSVSEKVLGLYEEYAERLVVIRFSGNQDRVHIMDRFELLYKAIWRSSTYYAFIDTDEFLYMHTGNKLISDERIIQYIYNNQDIIFFPTWWLRNDYFRDDIFMFTDDIKSLCSMIMFGKPIVNSRLIRDILLMNKVTMHTAQLPVAAYGTSPCLFVLLHLSHLSKMRRIMSNMEKLKSLGSIADARDFHAVAYANIEAIGNITVRRYVEEIRDLALSLGEHIEGPDRPLEIGPGHFTVDRQGALSFYPQELAQCFRHFVNAKRSFFDLSELDWSEIKGQGGSIWRFMDEENYKLHHRRP